MLRARTRPQLGTRSQSRAGTGRLVRRLRSRTTSSRRRATTGNTTRLSVPDTLKPADRQDIDTGTAGPLFYETRDPEFSPLTDGAQGVCLPCASSGLGPNHHHDIPNEIIFHPDHNSGESCTTDRGITL